MLTNKEDLLNYINNQPDDRPINFSENNSYDSCGCLMVHYFKDSGCKNFCCGVFTISKFDTNETLVVLDNEAGKIIFKLCSLSHIFSTYKDIKEYLTKQLSEV